MMEIYTHPHSNHAYMYVYFVVGQMLNVERDKKPSVNAESRSNANYIKFMNILYMSV